jgi:multidrug resistance protein MdtO
VHSRGSSLRNVNEVHVAIKAALTATVCGLFYEAVHQPGIGACVFAVLLLAQGTVGASLQRAVVQIAGVVVGATYALGVVTLMPNMTSVASLMVAVFPLFLGVAWLGYGGGITAGASLQMAMAAALVLLPVLGPTKDFAPGAERILGILLGNLVFALFNLTLWPAYADSPAPLSRIVRLLAQLERSVSGGDMARARAEIFDIHRSLAAALARQDEVRFEPLGRSPAAPLLRKTLFSLVRHLQDVFQALLAGARTREALDLGRAGPALGGAVVALESAIASRLDLHADSLEQGRWVEAVPLAAHLDRLGAAVAAEAQGAGAADWEAFVLRARRFLSEVGALEEVLRRYTAVREVEAGAVRPAPQPSTP